MTAIRHALIVTVLAGGGFTLPAMAQDEIRAEDISVIPDRSDPAFVEGWDKGDYVYVGPDLRLPRPAADARRRPRPKPAVDETPAHPKPVKRN